MAEPVPIRPMQPEPPFTKLGSSYRYRPPDEAVEFHLDRIERRDGDLCAQVQVRWAPPREGDIWEGRVNLQNTRSRDMVAKSMKARAELNWPPLLDLMSKLTVQAHLSGSPVIEVGALPPESEPPPVVEKLCLARSLNEIHAPPGTGKSLLALYVALSVHHGWRPLGLRTERQHALYLDWEDRAYRINRNLRMITNGLSLPPHPLPYRNMRTDGTLHDQIDSLRKQVRDRAVEFLVVDSFEKAAGLMDSRSAPDALVKQFVLDLDSLGELTILVIDHVSHQSRLNPRQLNGAYGSIMKAAWARQSWELKGEPRWNSPIQPLALYHYKTNDQKHLPIGYIMRFGLESVRFDLADVHDSPDLEAPLPLQHRIKALLAREGELRSSDIADRLEAGDGTIRKILQRFSSGKEGYDLFTKLPDGRWTLPFGNQDDLPF